MSQENVELVRRAYEVFNLREFSAASEFYSRASEFFAPDIEIDLSRNVFNPVTFRGYEGVELAVTMVNDVWDDFRFEVEELIHAGDKVFAAVQLSGKGKGSGVPVDQHDIHVCTIRDGKVVRIEVHRDRDEALKAAGLSA
jgi:ketosteroid isomerase-like protein